MALSRTDFEYICHVVRKHSAISLDEGKEYLAESRLNSLAQREGMGSANDLVAQLRVDKGHDLHRKVVEAMTTNETSFFRDIHPFEGLRKSLIPQLIQRRDRQRRLNVRRQREADGVDPVEQLVEVAVAGDLEVRAERLGLGQVATPHADKLGVRVVGERGRVHLVRPEARAQDPEAHGQTAPNWRSPASPRPGTM